MKTRIACLAVVAAALTVSGAWACLVPDVSGALRACTPCSDETLSIAMGLGASSEGVASENTPASLRLPGGESVVTVHVLNFDYSVNAAGPAVDPVIAAGDTVHWVFDTAFHSVTSATGSGETYDSGVMFSAGATFDHTFNTPGTYQYFCSIHGFDAGNGTAGGMAGIITVRAVPEPASLAALSGLLAAGRRRR